MLDRRLHPDESLISSLVVQITTWLLAISFISAVALLLLYQRKYEEFFDWVTRGWKASH